MAPSKAASAALAVILVATMPITAFAAPESAATEMSVPAMLCLAKLAVRLSEDGNVSLGTAGPIKVGPPFVLGATVGVNDEGPTITARFPGPYRPGPDKLRPFPPIHGGTELTCDREGRVLKEREWR
jgi:hypothetical protein